MKAIVYHRYGSPDVLQCEEIEKPTPADDEVLIRVHAASLNPLNYHLVRGKPYVVRILFGGLRKPKDKRLGGDVAGQVEAVGRNVTRFKLGDEVFGSCRGAFANYACASESRLVIKPGNVTFDQAAAVSGAACTALQGLCVKGKIRPGKKVLINGASGGVGTFAVQIAKSFDTEVTGVCSTRNLGMVRSIGADRVIDYTQEDFTKEAQRYDLIFDCAGNHSLFAYRRILNPKGLYVWVGAVGKVTGHYTTAGFLVHLLKMFILSRFVSQEFVMLFARPSKEDLIILRELIAAGGVAPVIDRRLSLKDVPEAMRYLGRGHARGKVVITIAQDSET